MPELPPPADPSTSYTAVIDTSAGEIRVELWPEAAPQTVGTSSAWPGRASTTTPSSTG